MNRFTAILASSALWFSLGANAFAADIYFTPGGGAEPNSCGEVSNEIPTVTSSGGIDNETGLNLRCITDIDALRLTLHKAGLCTSAPDTNDPSVDWADKCVFIIDDATGIIYGIPGSAKYVVEIAPGTGVNKANVTGGEIVDTEGTPEEASLL